MFASILTTCEATQPYSGSKPIVFEEVELAPPTIGMVKVKVEVASLCHSDLSVVNGSRARPTPIVLGHEASGTIIEIGPEVTDFKTGDRVAFTFQPACGQCDLCVSTDNQQCEIAAKANVDGTLMWGKTFLSKDGQPLHHHTGVSAFAQETVVHQSSIIKIADDVPFSIGALLGCAVTTGGGAVKNAAKVQTGERVAVIGAGGVGIAAMLVAKAMGAAFVDVVDPAENKHALLRELGASQVYLPADAPKEYYDVVIEAAGHVSALQPAMAMLRAGGRAVSVGLGDPAAVLEVNYLDLVFKSKSLIGSYHGSGDVREDLEEYIQMWRRGDLPLEKLVSKEVPLEELNQAMDDLQEARELRQLIRIP